MNLFSLDGKIALITGSGSGLGYVMAEGLGRAGAKIVLNGRTLSNLQKAQKQLKQQPIDVYFKRFDVTDEEQIAHAVSDIEKEIGAIDILVNNAGMTRRNSLESVPHNEFQQILDTDLVAPFLMAKHVVQFMIKRRRGKIINMCSLMSELGRATVGAYAAAKGGLRMLTRAMCVDWAQYNIQVNGIGPGYFITDLTRVLAEDSEFDAWLKKRTPAGRWGEPSELVGAAVFLASEASNFVNGQILYVDGGIMASL